MFFCVYRMYRLCINNAVLDFQIKINKKTREMKKVKK